MGIHPVTDLTGVSCDQVEERDKKPELGSQIIQYIGTTLKWIADALYFQSSVALKNSEGREIYQLEGLWAVQFSSVAQSCLALCDSMNCSSPGLPVHHQLPEFTQTHVRWVGDAIQPSHPLSSPSPPALNLSQHQCLFPVSQLFTSGGQSIGVSASASVLPMNPQDWSPLGWIGWISFQSKGLSRVFSNTTVQKHQFFSAQLSL